MEFKLGFATDIHNLIKNKPLILGGYLINDSEWGIQAHSDGDLILHAISSAILGALGLSITIGDLFSDADINNKGLNSILIFDKVKQIMKEKKMHINNLDLTIVCEQIMLSKHLKEIKKSLEAITKINYIGIKCTRYEDKNNFQITCNALVTLINN